MTNLITLLLALLLPFGAEAQKQEPWVNAQAFGLTAGGTAGLGAANRTALQNAINSLGSTGGTVLIPCGFYYVDPGITLTASQTQITITGCADGWSYEPKTLIYSPLGPTKYDGGTVIRWAAAGAIGFDLTRINNSAPSGNRIVLQDMVIAGGPAAAVSTCIKASGMVTLRRLDVEGCSEKGVWLYEFINSTYLDRISILANVGGTGIGMFVGTGGITLRDNTIFHMSNCTIRQNTVGMRIEQANTYTIDNCVIESNAGEGIVLYKQGTPGKSIDDGAPVGKSHSQHAQALFSNVWLENNGASTARPQLLIQAASATSYSTWDVPNNIVFLNSRFTSSCKVAGQSPCTAGWKPNINIENGVRIKFDNSVISTPDPYGDGPSQSPVTLGTYSQYVSFHNTLSSGGSNAVITNKGSQNVVHDWIEFDSFVVTLTGCTTATTGTAFYTRNGREVTIDWPALSCTTDGTKVHTLTGMAPTLVAANSKAFVGRITNGTSKAFGLVYMKGGMLALSSDAAGSGFTPGAVFAIDSLSTTFTTN